MPPTIALLTDFGCRDVFVGVMKGVILRAAPQARLIDLTHEIPAGDVRDAAFRLWQAAPFMPPGTILLAVVDPGVGSSRKPVAVSVGPFTCVGPDNGVFSYLLAGLTGVEAVEITAPGIAGPDFAVAGASDTFHGRDIFAPAAARLALGLPVSTLGPRIAALVTLPFPRLTCAQKELHGEVLGADGFGNIVTSIGRLRRTAAGMTLDPWIPTCRGMDLPPEALFLRLPDGRIVPLGRTFSDVLPGSLLAYIGSSGLVEIAVNNGSAQELLHCAPGAQVTLLLP
ncbi:MAG TPA: SAM-dependent chlorinase/fluorinase [Spirochaetia bacterium]|nr:SAM-dependent chlorinase/fluorinase [Spirochaetia bacterium]